MKKELTGKAILEKKTLIRHFLVKVVVLFLIWKIVFHALIVPSGGINRFLTTAVAHGTKLGGQLLGYDARVEVIQNKNLSTNVDGIVYFNEEPAVLVGDPCNGLELFALFIGFLVCFPGPALPKVLFSLIGTSILFVVNIIREILLAFNYLYFRSSFDFNHKYTYAIAVYVIVFLIWKYWLNRYSSLAYPDDEPKN